MGRNTQTQGNVCPLFSSIRCSLLTQSHSPFHGPGDYTHLSYPQPRRVDYVDTYFGTKVADPYRWLEDDVRNSPEVAEWVKAENRLTEADLAPIPTRDDPPPLDRTVELRPVFALYEGKRPLLLF